MSYFSASVEAALAGRTLTAVILGRFDFATETMRLWMGHGLIRAGGFTWRGAGDLGSISGIEQAVDGIAPVVTFGLSGVKPELVAKALNASAEVKGRVVVPFLQVFDAETRAPLDAPYAFWLGRMDVMSIETAGPAQRVISLTAETFFARRGSSALGWLTDRSQQKDYPGDRGLEFVPAIPNLSTTWPAFVLAWFGISSVLAPVCNFLG